MDKSKITTTQAIKTLQKSLNTGETLIINNHNAISSKEPRNKDKYTSKLTEALMTDRKERQNLTSLKESSFRKPLTPKPAKRIKFKNLSVDEILKLGYWEAMKTYIQEAKLTPFAVIKRTAYTTYKYVIETDNNVIEVITTSNGRVINIDGESIPAWFRLVD